MSKDYTPNKFENKYIEAWDASGIYTADLKNTNKKTFYSLYSFPYPSGSGLHVGHVEGMVANDIVARYYRMNDYEALLPMGWDSFGLPAENFAIKTGVPPKESTEKAIKTFINQIKRLGISVDWSTEVGAHEPNYYKWTQWIFIKLYENGLANRKLAVANWCPSCQTVLANEQVVDGKCERCDSNVEQKEILQWSYKITKYVEELISGLDTVDWPESTKQMQKNWIGKSTGASLKFMISDYSYTVEKRKVNSLEVFTTRPDTIFGATFMVVAPEHPLISDLIKNKNIKENDLVSQYVSESLKKTEEERLINKDKTGIFSGIYVINPANNKKIPVWVSDYVLMGYGTGAIMAVPAHDDRDHSFATKFNLDIVPVIASPNDTDLPYVGDGKIINSGDLNGLQYPKDYKKVLSWIEKSGFGKPTTTYRLRDWIVSRQRYWGAPIPIVYDPEGNPHAVKEDHLPWLLPTDVDFKPTGESPLKTSKEFKERVEKLYGKGWTPEYDTLDTFVDSSWYFLRHLDSKNDKEFAEIDILNKWMPVDLYMIGAEHTVLHLLYARFFTKFLSDLEYLEAREPFQKMRHMGLILGPDGRKMSKRWGNVINPNDVVDLYGGDTIRIYEMFMGPLYAEKPWDDSSVSGVHRFLSRIYRLFNSEFSENSSEEMLSLLHKTIKKVQEDIDDLKFNTAVASMMEFTNSWMSSKSLAKDDALLFLKILAPFAPFMTEEIYFSIYASKESIHKASWPKFDSSLIQDKNIILPIQVNGKRRGELQISSSDIDNKELVLQKAQEIVSKYLDDSTIKKQIYVPQKIVNFVVD